MAESGTSTSRLNQSMAMPRPRPAPGVRVLRGVERFARAGPASLWGRRPGVSIVAPERAVDMGLLLALLAELLLERGDDAEGVALLAVAEVLVCRPRPSR